MGLSAWPLSRYSRCRPSSRTSTAPTSRSTRRCLDTCGWARPRSETRSFTGRSPPARTSRICRRRGSATALNASVVVAARATAQRATRSEGFPDGTPAIIFLYGNVSTPNRFDPAHVAVLVEDHLDAGVAREVHRLGLASTELEQQCAAGFEMT